MNMAVSSLTPSRGALFFYGLALRLLRGHETGGLVDRGDGVLAHTRLHFLVHRHQRLLPFVGLGRRGRVDRDLAAGLDAVHRRRVLGHDTALRRLEGAGVILTTAETVVFEWTGGAHHPKFKQISVLVQDRMKQLT